MTNYLIIYEEVPETTKIYYASDVTEEEAKKLDACHNKMVNHDEWPESGWLASWLKSDGVALLIQDKPTDLYSLSDLRIIITGFIM